MRRSLVKFSESEASNHTPSLADFTTTTPELKFSVHTAGASRRKSATPSRAQGEGEMTIPRPQEWTKAEVHQLRTLAKRKVSADSIAKSFGRHVGSVRTKALELRLILSRKVKATGK